MPLLPGPLWPGLVVLIRVSSIGQIDVSKELSVGGGRKKKCHRHVDLVKLTSWQAGWLKQWSIKCVETKVYVGKPLKSKLVRSVLIFELRTGIDHPEWGLASEVGIMLKDPPQMTQQNDITDDATFLKKKNQTIVFLTHTKIVNMNVIP